MFSLPLLTNAQEKCQAYAGNIESNVDLILRAKALSMFMIEDYLITGLSAGAEVQFFDKFSIVVDIVNLRYRNEEEVPINPPESSPYNEYWQKDIRTYLAFETRYYPSFLQFDMWRFYLNGYSKVGGRFLHTQDLYPLKEDQLERLNSNFFDFGSSLGFRFGYWWGFDFNVGAAYRNETKNEDFHHIDAPSTYTKDVNDARWVPNIRASFYFNLGEY